MHTFDTGHTWATPCRIPVCSACTCHTRATCSRRSLPLSRSWPALVSVRLWFLRCADRV